MSGYGTVPLSDLNHIRIVGYSRGVGADRRALARNALQRVVPVKSYVRKGKFVRRYSRSKHLSNGRN